MTGISNRIGLAVGAALVALGLASVYVSAQNSSGDRGPLMGWGGRGPGGPGRGGPMGMLGLSPMLMERLNLSDAQRDQVKSIVEAHRDEIKALGDRAFEANLALDSAVTADTVDETAIRSRSAEVATVQADMAVARAKIRAEVWQILTPDQQEQAKTLQARMDQRKESGRQRRQGRGGAQ